MNSMLRSMSSETTAALLGALVGAGGTLIITLLGRWWTSRDARAGSRRLYAEAVERRLQGFIRTQEKAELDEIMHESFGVTAMGRFVPSRAAAVHVWFAFQQSKLFDDATQKVKAGEGEDWAKRQVQLYGDASDVMSEINQWARGSLLRTPVWFWVQLRTTLRYEWIHAQRLAKQEGRKERAARRAKTRAAIARLRAERKTP